MKFHSKKISEVLTFCNSNINGLTEDIALQNKNKFGENVITKKQQKGIKLLKTFI